MGTYSVVPGCIIKMNGVNGAKGKSSWISRSFALVAAIRGNGAGPRGESDETRLGKILAICNFTGEGQTEG